MRKTLTIILALVAILSMTAFIACKKGNEDPKPNKYTVTVVNGTGGGQFDENTSCTVTATVEEGMQFVNWIVDEQVASTENPYTFTVTSDVTITATVTEIPTVNPPETYNVTINGGTGSGEYEENQEVTASVVYTAEHNNKVFTGWYNDSTLVSAEEEYTFSATADLTLTAQFKNATWYTQDSVTGADQEGNPVEYPFALDGEEITFDTTVEGQVTVDDTFNQGNVNGTGFHPELYVLPNQMLHGNIGNYVAVDFNVKLTLNQTTADNPIFFYFGDGADFLSIALYYQTVPGAGMLWTNSAVTSNINAVCRSDVYALNTGNCVTGASALINDGLNPIASINPVGLGGYADAAGHDFRVTVENVVAKNELKINLYYGAEYKLIYSLKVQNKQFTNNFALGFRALNAVYTVEDPVATKLTTKTIAAMGWQQSTSYVDLSFGTIDYTTGQDGSITVDDTKSVSGQNNTYFLPNLVVPVANLLEEEVSNKVSISFKANVTENNLGNQIFVIGIQDGFDYLSVLMFGQVPHNDGGFRWNNSAVVSSVNAIGNAYTVDTGSSPVSSNVNITNGLNPIAPVDSSNIKVGGEKQFTVILTNDLTTKSMTMEIVVDGNAVYKLVVENYAFSSEVMFGVRGQTSVATYSKPTATNII